MQLHYCLLINHLNKQRSTTHSLSVFSTLLLFSTLGLTTRPSYAIGVNPAPFQQATPPSTPTSKTPICAGQPTNSKQARSSAATSTEDDASMTDQDKKDKFKLSTNSSSEKQSDLQGEFCKREHKENGAWKPSAADAPVETPARKEPPPTPQPIAVFSGGKLTIHAHGEDLIAVMNAVQSATGMTIETPAGGENEPFYIEIGPVPMRDALVALLDGTKYNYLIQSSSQNPEIAKRLILSPKSHTTVAMASGPGPGEQDVQKAALYGSQGFQDEQQTQAQAQGETQLPVPAQPTAIPTSVPVGVNVQQMATDSHRSVGEVLGDLQKKQQQMLDDQAVSQGQSQPQQ